MGKCWKCNKEFSILSKSGLCISCLEDAADSSINLISMIKAGGAERQKALDLIDNYAAAELTEAIKDDLEHSPFSVWDKSVHSTKEQLERIRRSKSVKILSYDNETQTAKIKGSGIVPYTTTFSSCTCGDFISRKLPCKHIYKLAAEYGNINFKI